MDSWLLIFVTSATYAGGFGGPPAADRICNAHAQAAGLTDTYVAWLSTSTQDARDRVPPTLGFRRVDGTLIANDLRDLTDGHLAATIAMDETGAMASRGARAWTGTTSDGMFPRRCRGERCRTQTTCGDWTSSEATFNGLVGQAHAVEREWTDADTVSCAVPQRLYCVSQGTVGVPALPGPWLYVATLTLIVSAAYLLARRRLTLG